MGVFAVIAVLILWLGTAGGVPAPGLPEIHYQPDGKQITLKKWGDEWLAGYETLEGYTVVKDSSGYWVYATLSLDGELIPTSFRADLSPPAWIKPQVRPVSEITIQRASALKVQASQKVVPPTGTGMLPVVLMNFADTTTTYTQQDFNNLIFGTNVFSLKDYYEEVSYGNFTVDGVVIGWFTSSNNHDYYGANVNNQPGDDAKPGTLVYEAAQQADPTVDFSLYDTDGDCKVDVLAVVHQGLGEEAPGSSPSDIWSHRWSLSGAYAFGRSDFGPYTTNDTCRTDSTRNVVVDDYIIMPEKFNSSSMSTVGVFVHEYAHALGLPDLYDVDYSSNGVGDWELMASGSWNGLSLPGDRPAHLSAHSKAVLGWVTVSKVTASGTYTLTPVINDPTQVIQILDGTPGSSGEYFLLENRIKSGFDRGIPGEGLLIWHVDESKFTGLSNNVNVTECPTNHSDPSCASDHYGLALEQADGLFDLERRADYGDSGDPFPGSTGNTAFDFGTTPTNSLYGGTDPGFSVSQITRSGQNIILSLSFGIAQPVPDIDVQPPSHNFGSVEVGSTATQVFRIINRGTGDLNVSGISISGPDAGMFSYSATGGSSPCGSIPVTVPPGSECTVSVSVTPSRTGAISAQMDISSDDPDTPVFTVSLSATGTQPPPPPPPDDGDGDGENGCPNENPEQAAIMLIPVAYITFRRIRRVLSSKL